jgi:hypothetical protein
MSKVLDEVLRKIPRHRGVTLRTGLDRTLARSSRKSTDRATILDADYETERFASGTRAQKVFETESEAKKLAEQLKREGWQDVVVWRAASGWVARGMKDSALDRALAQIPIHKRAGDHLRARLGLTGLDATLALIPDRRVRDAEGKLVKTLKNGVKIYETARGWFRAEFPDGDSGEYPDLKSAIQQSTVMEERGVRDGLSRPRGRSNETATEMLVPERDVAELVRATGDQRDKSALDRALAAIPDRRRAADVASRHGRIRDSELTGEQKREYELLKKRVDESEYYEKLSPAEYKRWKFLCEKQGVAP